MQLFSPRINAALTFSSIIIFLFRFHASNLFLEADNLSTQLQFCLLGRLILSLGRFLLCRRFSLYLYARELMNRTAPNGGNVKRVNEFRELFLSPIGV